MIESNSVIQGDCLIEMQKIPDKSIDMILCDLPYGTTACKWDTIIPFEPLWEQYKRIIKDNGAIVLTASQPFTSALVMSNIKMFKYEWIWKKNAGSNFATVKYQPMKEHENILVFSNGTTKYNQQKQQRSESGLARVKSSPMTFNRKTDGVYKDLFVGKITKSKADELRCPSSVQNFNRERGLHPTQKPVALFEYLIKTYTNEGDLVLDNCAGSFTTAIASENLKRNWICIEKEAEYCAIGEKRIKENRERLHNIDIINNRLTPKEIK
jgi:site-specific DNA-methyltransferase (adenine-specific)